MLGTENTFTHLFKANCYSKQLHLKITLPALVSMCTLAFIFSQHTHSEEFLKNKIITTI